MTLIEKTLKENTDKLLTKIALDYANNLITVPAIFERLEEELPILITQALQEQDRESRRKVLVSLYDHSHLGSDFVSNIEHYAKQHNIDLKQDDDSIHHTDFRYLTKEEVVELYNSRDTPPIILGNHLKQDEN